MNPGMILLIMMLANGGRGFGGLSDGRGIGSLGSAGIHGNGGLLRSSRNMFSVQTADDFLLQLHRAMDTLDKVSNVTHSLSALQLPSQTTRPLNTTVSYIPEPYDEVINTEVIDYEPSYSPAPTQPPASLPDINQLMQTIGPMLQMFSKQNA